MRILARQSRLTNVEIEWFWGLFSSLFLCLPQWKVDQGVQFVPHVTAVREALQMDHQYRR